MLHQARGFIETDFEELCEDHSLPDKLSTLEAMCEEQGIADGDAAEAARCVRAWAACSDLLMKQAAEALLRLLPARRLQLMQPQAPPPAAT